MNQSTDLPLTGKILVVDDTPVNLRILEEFLLESGFEVMTATSGSEALKIVAADRPDIILMDVIMPEIDGFETCRRLKADDNLREIPVIFTTSLTRTSDKVKGFEVGAVDYITKPYQLEEVLARVHAHLTIQKLQRDLQAKNTRLQQEIAVRQQVEAQLRHSQEQANQLLLNILPQGVIDQLKQEPGSIAQQFDAVTVLFADIVNFSRLSSHLTPMELIGLLNEIFSTFDDLAERHGLEKIKTIGDGYMVVGGLPTPRLDHAPAVADMALDMLTMISQFKIQDDEPFTIRIGINSGPVIAGIIGRKKFSYDLWGDTVNIASRMALHGVSGQAQVTPATHALLHDNYTFTERGEIDVKGKGNMTTYFLTGRTRSWP